MTGDVTIAALLIVCMGLTIGGFAIKRPAIAFLGAGFWLASTVYGIVNGTPWDVTYIIGFMSIAGVMICAIDAGMMLNRKEEKQEDGDDIDPDIKELQRDRQLMYREVDALRGRPTRTSEKKQMKGLLP